MRLDASQAFGRRMHATRCEIVGLPLGEHSRVLMIVLIRSVLRCSKLTALPLRVAPHPDPRIIYSSSGFWPHPSCGPLWPSSASEVD